MLAMSIKPGDVIEIGRQECCPTRGSSLAREGPFTSTLPRASSKITRNSPMGKCIEEEYYSHNRLVPAILKEKGFKRSYGLWIARLPMQSENYLFLIFAVG
jgi:hypothetical protein